MKAARACQAASAAHRHRPRLLRRDAPLCCRRSHTALDRESERLVQKRRTDDGRPHTIVIAHRLAPSPRRRRIIVMDMAGSSRKATMAPDPQGGLYARLARLQFDGIAA